MALTWPRSASPQSSLIQTSLLLFLFFLLLSLIPTRARSLRHKYNLHFSFATAAKHIVHRLCLNNQYFCTASFIPAWSWSMWSLSISCVLSVGSTLLYFPPVWSFLRGLRMGLYLPLFLIWSMSNSLQVDEAYQSNQSDINCVKCKVIV